MTVESSTQAPRIFRLSQITSRLKDILLEATAKKFWLKAQLVPDRSNTPGGHFYGQLVEKDAKGNDIARLRVTIWKSSLEKIERSLREKDPEYAAILRSGGEVCALCSIRYHEVYGLSLEALELDPDLGESELARNRRQILESLQRDGLLDRNRGRRLPAAPLRIGLVTASDSAAYADFLRTLTHSGFSVRILHAPAVMQGASTATSVSSAITRLSGEALDVVCIIRGGGSPLDLAWLDHERIARAIADSPHPVWVGIGHEIDFGVLDHVAHTSHKTPTAVAEALVGRLRELEARLEIAADRLSQSTDRSIQLAERRVVELENGLQQGTRKHLTIQTERFKQRANRLQSAVAQISERTARRQQFAQAQLAERTRRIEEDAQQRLQKSAEEIRKRTEWHVAQAGHTLARASQGLLNGSRKHLDHFVERVLRLRLRLSSGIDRHASRIGQSQAIKVIRIEASAQRLIDSAVQLQRSRSQRIRLGTYESRLSAATRELEQRQKRLEAMSPERLLAKGYSITRTTEGELVRSVANLEAGARIVTQLQDGTVTSIVEDQNELRDKR